MAKEQKDKIKTAITKNSPEMNPIEHVWKMLKQDINHLRGDAPLSEITQEAKHFLNKKTFNYKLFGLGKF